MNEIERKFLLAVDPSIILEKTGCTSFDDGRVEYDQTWGVWFETKRITQHYLKDTGDWAIRVREYSYGTTPETTATTYVQTMKKRISDRSSWEIEEPITRDAYHALANNRVLTTPGLIKLRYDIAYKDLTWELDIFQNPEYSTIALVEVEILSEDQIFPIPFWVGEEVTHDKKYRNARMARKLEK